jgi:lariat debranching enzyme
MDQTKVVDVPIAPGASVHRNKDGDVVPLLTYDPEWLAITRAFHPYLSTTIEQPSFPSETQAREMVKNELEWVSKHLGSQDALKISDCQQFIVTAPAHKSGDRATMQQRAFEFGATPLFTTFPFHTNVLAQHLGTQTRKRRRFVGC